MDVTALEPAEDPSPDPGDGTEKAPSEPGSVAEPEASARPPDAASSMPVSYTHLTLPTILLV